MSLVAALTSRSLSGCRRDLKALLQLFREQLAAFVVLGIEHLRAVVLTLLKLVLMDADEGAAGVLFDQLEPVVKIGNLFSRMVEAESS